MIRGDDVAFALLNRKIDELEAESTMLKESSAQAYRAALEAAAKVARDYAWVLPMYENKEMNIASDDAAESVCEQIAAAIRALPVPQDDGDVTTEYEFSDASLFSGSIIGGPDDAGKTDEINKINAAAIEKRNRDLRRGEYAGGDMVLVPKDPTPEMLEAASGHYLLASIYRAMIRAAGGKK